MRTLFTILAVLWATSAFAATSRDISVDNISNTTGGASLAVPAVGTTIATDSNTITFTNKQLSAGQITGTITAAQGGTGASSFTSNGILYGNGTSPLQVTAAGTQFQVLQAGSGGVPQFGAVNLAQSAAVTGTLPVGNGGSGAATFTAHGVLVGEGTSAFVPVNGSSAGQVLTWNASGDPSFQSPAAMAPTINGTVASPLSVTAGSGIVLSTPSYVNIAFIAGSSSGTTVVTATPSITACTNAGQTLQIVSESATNLVTLQNNADLSGSQLLLNGPWTSGMNNSSPYVLNLTCDGAGTPHWVETSRNN